MRARRSTTSAPGYSSLAYLQRLPVDELKIDRSFVMRHARRTPATPRSCARRSTSATTSASTVVAEGVEDEAALTFLRELGCDIAQGYYIAKPMRAADVESWVRTSAWPVLVEA